MAQHGIYTINGVTVASPVTFEPILNDIDGDSKRNESQTMVRIVLRPDVHKYKCEWKGITSSQKNVILKNTSADEGYETFTAVVDNVYDEKVEMKFYRGTDVTVSNKKYYPDGTMTCNLSFNIIEV